jgi:hypothetical protein
LNFDVVWTPGVTVIGKVVVPGQSALPATLTVELLPLRGRHFSSDNKSPVKPDGSFNFAGLEGTPHRMRLSGLAPNYFVKSMEYDGSAVMDDTLPFAPSGMAQSLVVILGDGPATLRGRVMDGNKHTREPYVVLSRWPARDPYAQSQQVRGDREGRFTVSGVTPGDYKIIAYLESDGDKLNEPGILPWLLLKANLVSLQERSVQDIEIQLSRP